MSLPDSAEYWWDVKGWNGGHRQSKKVFTHIKNKDCGHYHVYESDELDAIDCHACLKIIEQDEQLKETLSKNNGKRMAKYERRRKKKKGYKLSSQIGFGKFKHQKTIQELIHTEKSYWNWVCDKLVLHPEVDIYLEKLKS